MAESKIIEVTATKEQLIETGLRESLASRLSGQRIMAFIKKFRTEKGFYKVARFEGFTLTSDLFKVVPVGCPTLRVS